MHGPLAYSKHLPGVGTGLYLNDLYFVTGTGPFQTEIVTIEGFDALVDEYRPDFVMFGFYGYPRRGVAVEKARKLVEKLLRQYKKAEWGRFR